MMNNIRNMIVVLIFATFCGVLVAGETDSGLPKKLSGIIVDQTGKPLNRALCYVETRPQIAATTRTDGLFELSGNIPAAGKLLFYAPGKSPKSIAITGFLSDGKVVMEQENAAFTKLEVGAATTQNIALAVFRLGFEYDVSDFQKEAHKVYIDFLAEKGDPSIGGECHFMLIGEIAAREEVYTPAAKLIKKG